MRGLIVYYFRKMRFRKREGVSLVECLLLLIVVAFTLGAILQTSTVTSQMHVVGRKYVESHKSVVSFFNTLEAIGAVNIINVSGDILDAVKKADSLGDFSYILSPEIVASTDSYITVRVYVDESKRVKRSISKNINIFSNSTVSDDRVRWGYSNE